MKIDKSNTIRIANRISSLNIFKNIKKGSEVSARVAKRIDDKKAVLEIAGRRVKAEFTGGVPDKNRLYLVLKEKGDGIFL